MTQAYTASGFTADIPSVSDAADIVAAFQDYHTDIAASLATFVKLSGASQTVSSPVVLSGGTTISGSSLSVTATTVTMSGAVTLSSTLDVTGLLTATAGVKGDVYSSNSAIKILENGTGVTGTNAGAPLTNNDAILYGTAATARSAVLYKAAGGDFGTTMDGYRRIFVGASAPTGTLNAGDIWMW